MFENWYKPPCWSFANKPKDLIIPCWTFETIKGFVGDSVLPTEHPLPQRASDELLESFGADVAQ